MLAVLLSLRLWDSGQQPPKVGQKGAISWARPPWRRLSEPISVYSAILNFTVISIAIQRDVAWKEVIKG